LFNQYRLDKIKILPIYLILHRLIYQRFHNGIISSADEQEGVKLTMNPIGGATGICFRIYTVRDKNVVAMNVLHCNVLYS
jgi:hypothetical protein